MKITSTVAEIAAAEKLRELELQVELAGIEDKMKRTKQVEAVKQLSLHIDKVWLRNKQDNKNPRLETVGCLRRVRGEYDPTRLADIRAFRGSECFLRSGETKARAAYSWIADIYRGDTDLPWSLEPTAVPSMPDQTKEEIKQQIIARGIALRDQMVAEAEALGQPLDTDLLAKTMNDWQKVAEKKAVEMIGKEAKERCDAAAKQIRDQNQEGNWNEAFSEFLWWFIRGKCGIIKGPTLVEKKEQAWALGEDGQPAFVTKKKLATDVYA
jgi:hypothetical protein